MKRGLLLSRLALAGLLLTGGAAQAVGIKLRPQGDVLTRTVQAVLAELSTKEVPMTLDTSGGPTLTLGGVGASAAPFNPDESGRVVQVGSERRLEFNPRSPVPLLQAVRDVLRDELKLKDWTPAAAQLRFGGADLNGDGVVDLSDLAVLMDNYGKANAYLGDLNQDRKVNDADVQIFMALYRAAFAYQDPLGPVPTTDSDATSTPATASPAATSTSTPPAGPTSATTSPASTTSTSTTGTTTPVPTSPAAPGSGTPSPSTPGTSTTTPVNPTTPPAPTKP